MESEPLGQELSDQDRVLLVFGYLGPLALVPLVASKREFVKWHAKQGLVLSAGLLALFIVMRLIHLLLESYFWRWIEEIFWAAAWMVVLGVVVLMLVCLVRALEGERFKIPMLGDLADRL
jgi:uncharacterized membrane protein